MSAVKALKKQFRQRIKHALSELSADAVASQTSNATKTLLSLPEYQAARRISVYLSMPSGEISTSGIVEDALIKGKKVYIPYTYKLAAPASGQPSAIMDMVELHSLQEYKTLQPDKWGIPTPAEDSIAMRKNSFGGQGMSHGEAAPGEGNAGGLDLIVVPGMAFDSGFGRLGHGKGFYDYFFDRSLQHSKLTNNARMPFLVGLALNEQLLPSTETVPMDDTDWRLDALVLGDGQLLRAQK